MAEGESGVYTVTVENVDALILRDIELDLQFGNAFSPVSFESDCGEVSGGVRCTVDRLFRSRSEDFDFVLEATGDVCGLTQITVNGYVDSSSSLGSQGSALLTVHVDCPTDDDEGGGEESDVVETCHDTDGGISPGVSGQTEWDYNAPNVSRSRTVTDRCSEDRTQLIEQYCDGVTPLETTVDCENGCNANACVDYTDPDSGGDDEEEEDPAFEQCTEVERDGDDVTLCALCGNGICEDVEQGVPSRCIFGDRFCFRDTVSVSCPADCGE